MAQFSIVCMNTVILKLYILAKQAVKFVTHSKTAGEMPPRDVTQEPTLCGSLGKFFVVLF